MIEYAAERPSEFHVEIRRTADSWRAPHQDPIERNWAPAPRLSTRRFLHDGAFVTPSRAEAITYANACDDFVLVRIREVFL